MTETWGGTATEVGNTLASTTNSPSMAWARPSGSITDVFGSPPMASVPCG